MDPIEVDKRRPRADPSRNGGEDQERARRRRQQPITRRHDGSGVSTGWRGSELVSPDRLGAVGWGREAESRRWGCEGRLKHQRVNAHREAAQFNGIVSGRPASAWGKLTARTGPPDTTFFIFQPDMRVE